MIGPGPLWYQSLKESLRRGALSNQSILQGWSYDSFNYQLHRGLVEKIWNREDSRTAIQLQDLANSFPMVVLGVNLFFKGHYSAEEFNQYKQIIWPISFFVDNLVTVDPETQEGILTIIVRSSVNQPKFSHEGAEEKTHGTLIPAFQTMPMNP